MEKNNKPPNRSFGYDYSIKKDPYVPKLDVNIKKRRPFFKRRDTKEISFCDKLGLISDLVERGIIREANTPPIIRTEIPLIDMPYVNKVNKVNKVKNK